MDVKMSDFVALVGKSVQEARRALEDQAVELYFQGYKTNEGNIYSPVTKRIQLPTSTAAEAPVKTVDIPVTALYHHHVMALDTVNVKLKFIPCEKDGDLHLTLQPYEGTGPEGESFSELSLSFQTQECPEGMARINEQSVKIL